MAEPGSGPCDRRDEEPGPAGKEEAAPAPKKRRLAGGERYVPPPRKLSTGVSFGAEHFAETSYYFEGGLRKNNDFLRNTVHRHEPPVTAQPLRILAEDEEVVVVDKPSSLPVHPCGRFRHNTVIFILGKEHGLTELHTLHRLDRMTSGVLMFAKTVAVSKRIDEQVRERQLEKEYICRVVGEFPEHEVVCEEPILVVSYKVGVCRVDPKGKSCKTIFQRLSYNGKTSVVKCLPRTGRTHQIRVHLQYLGHPIVNDPIYNMEAWGPDRGKGGKIGKTDEELLKALVEEHHSKQSLEILGILEEDLNISGENKDCRDSGDCTKSAEADPINGSSCPAEDKKDPQSDEKDPKKDTKDSERGDITACPPDSGINLEMLDKDKELGLCGHEGGPVGQKGWEEKDPLCVECRMSRRDPSPEELVMFLHALRYKGPEFEYCSDMPEWAMDDWEE
ncbi:RNA pseudouridylate synthase domain-containing protein 2 [Willisornis vidua]|uniref:Pseudouridine synthase n=1 Tax=Willisornis vidua TaxID=1566151 RepID=A0ABQ9DK02_9PASS|nr:RNA pseudouridylate synthase domain-containing protein 2 [Willisornis vidua]